MDKTVNKLEEKFRALNSAIKLYSFAGNIRANTVLIIDYNIDCQEVFLVPRDPQDHQDPLDPVAFLELEDLAARMTRTWMRIWTVGS